MNAEPSSTAIGGSSGSTTTTDTVAPAVTTTTTTAASSSGNGDCSEIWPEPAVMDIAGEAFTLSTTNADRSACIFGSVPTAMTLSFRPGDAADLEIAKGGVALLGELTELDVCDGGYVTTLEGAVTIVEVLDNAAGRVYNGTLTPMDDVKATGIAVTSYPCS